MYFCNDFKFEMITILKTLQMNASKQYLLNFGIKPSLQRLAVMKYLMQYHTHPTVDEIYAALHSSIPTLSKTTIYNTLSLFLEEGVIQAVSIDTKNIRYDIDIHPHAHFKCKKCHSIIDVPVPKLCDEIFSISEEFKDLEIQDVEVALKGICKKCKEGEEENRFNQ